MATLPSNAIRIAEYVFLNKVDELEGLGRITTAHKAYKQREVTPQAVREWLAGVQYEVGTHRVLKTYAMAYYSRQLVKFNPLFLDSFETRFVLDLVLHELGHLFTYHFYGTIGHEWSWQRVGSIVGYVPLGATTEANRRRLMTTTYIPEGPKDDIHSEPLGKVAAASAAPVRQTSTARAPVHMVHELCAVLVPAGYSRKAVIGFCVARGVNPNTAATQYSVWKKKYGY